MKELLNVIGDRFPLTPRDAGEFAVLKAKGFFGLMKMETLIVNPKEIDLPLYSCDRILAMGNDTLIAELYDTAVGGFSAPELDKIVAEAAALPERDPRQALVRRHSPAAEHLQKGEKGAARAL